MVVRFFYNVIVATLSTWAVLVVASAQTQERGVGVPPEESAVITVAGCLQRGGTNGDKYVLADPIRGPIASVPQGTCRASVNEQALELEHTTAQGFNESMLGMWIEVNGRLEKETSDDPSNLRELHIRSFRLVPVVPPAEQPRVEQPRVEQPRAEALPAPAAAPHAEVIAPAEEIPVATTGTAPTVLPTTSSPAPLVGSIGLLLLAGGLALRRFNRWRAR